MRFCWKFAAGECESGAGLWPAGKDDGSGTIFRNLGSSHRIQSALTWRIQPVDATPGGCGGSESSSSIFSSGVSQSHLLDAIAYALLEGHGLEESREAIRDVLPSTRGSGAVWDAVELLNRG